MSQKSIASYFSNIAQDSQASSSVSEEIPLEITEEQLGRISISSAEEILDVNEEVDIFDDEISEDEIVSPKKRKYTHKTGSGKTGGNSKFESHYAVIYKDEFIEQSGKGLEYFYCKACNQHLKLLKMGESRIKDHLQSEKHKKSAADYRTNAPLVDFVKRKTVVPFLFATYICD